MKNYETINILMVEDDSIDVKMFQRSLARNNINNSLHLASDGEKALEMLRTDQVSKPFLIVLDLNMPRMNGIEFLSELRQDNKLRDSVVFVMTTSSSENDKIEAYKYNIAGYMVKSDLGESFLDAVKLIDQYWKTIQLPL